MEQSERKPEDERDDDELEEASLDAVSGGTQLATHEIVHVVQQSDTSVGQNQTITVGAARTIAVGASKD
jgi:hypothetical protein